MAVYSSRWDVSKPKIGIRLVSIKWFGVNKLACLVSEGCGTGPERNGKEGLRNLFQTVVILLYSWVFAMYT